MDALLDLLHQLEGVSYHKEGFSGVVLSITGFYGEERQAVRSIAAQCHITFSPSLVEEWTTHLVCSGPESAQRSNKMAKARVWGIPTLNLQWLLDSIRDGCPLPVSSAYVVYLPMELPPQPPQQQEQEEVQQQQQERAPQAHHYHRPSSVASSAQPTAAGPLGSPPPPRPALQALDNVVQQLHAVSISPAVKSQPGPGDQHDGSPQQSLSFQHLVGRAQSGSPAPVSSRLGAGVTGGQASPRFWPSPGLAGPGGQQGCEGPTPMCSPDGSVGSGAGQGPPGNNGSPSTASDCSMEAGSVMSLPAEAWGQNGGNSPSSQVAAAGHLSSGESMQRLADSSDEEEEAQQLWAEQQQRQHQTPQRHTFDEHAELSGSGLHSPELPSPASGSLQPASLAAASPAGSFDEMPEATQQWAALGSLPQEKVGMEDSPSAAGSVPSTEAAAQPSKLHSGRQQQEEYQPPLQQQPNFVCDHRGGYRGASKKKGIEDWTDDETDDEFPTPPDPCIRRMPREEDGPVIIARPAPSASALPLSADTVGVKLLQRPPRGNCVRENHGLSTLKQVQFAEQVQVADAGLLLSTKDKKVAVKLRLGGHTMEGEGEFQDSSTSGTAADTVLGEARTFYRLPDGSWHLEFCQLYTAQQAEQLAAERGVQLALPVGFDRTNELLKSTERQSMALSDVAGTVAVRQVKQGGTQLRLKGGGSAAPAYFWRTAFDPATAKCVTDRPVTDFVAE